MFQLTCRARARGRGLAPVAPVEGTPDPATSGLDRLTLFIHGYNNDHEEATAAWRRTSDALLRRNVDTSAVVLFYWPGDYSRWEAVAALSYPLTVPVAEETARLLVLYLTGVVEARRRTLSLSFVAHSLGALVTLESLRLLRDARLDIVIDHVLLMAAAVPEGFCTSGETYGDAFSAATREMVLYSLDDPVLKKYFQVGQEIALRFPEQRQRAVGRTGGPGAGPGRRWYTNAHMDGFEHGDYWRKPESVDEIAAILPTLENAALPLEGALPQSALPKDVLPSGGIPDFRELPPDLHLGWLRRPPTPF